MSVCICCGWETAKKEHVWCSYWCRYRHLRGICNCPRVEEAKSVPRCPAHLVPEPCPTCTTYIAAGL